MYVYSCVLWREHVNHFLRITLSLSPTLPTNLSSSTHFTYLHAIHARHASSARHFQIFRESPNTNNQQRRNQQLAKTN